MTLTIDVIGIVVKNMAASLAFYRHLGLEIPTGAEDEPHVDVELGDGRELTFDTEEVMASFDPGFTPPTGSGRMSLALRAETPEEVDETYATMVIAGHHGHLDPFDAFWGQRYAVLHDPDDNVVSLYAQLPG